VHSDGRREPAAARSCQEVARAGDDERRDEEPPDDGLGEAQERQLEQVVGDVAPEDRVDDRCGAGRGERHAVLPEQDRVPAAGQRARRSDGGEHGDDGQAADDERREVRHLVGFEGDRRGAVRPVPAGWGRRRGSRTSVRPMASVVARAVAEAADEAAHALPAAASGAGEAPASQRLARRTSAGGAEAKSRPATRGGPEDGQATL
jgi:hypothetical protein